MRDLCAGASALEQVLTTHSGLDLRAFIVWEPVLPSDVKAPGTSKLAIVSDSRAAQYWDPKRTLSQELVAAAMEQRARYEPVSMLPDGMGLSDVTADTIAWDIVLLFGPGATWKDAPPVPIFVGAPVVEVAAGLSTALDAHQP